MVRLTLSVPCLSFASCIAAGQADWQHYIPGGAASGGGPSAGGSFSVSGSGCAGAMQQCGGDWYGGPSCCEAGYTCAENGHYAGYKECMPIAGNSNGGGSSVDGGARWAHYVQGGGGAGGSHGSSVQLGGDWQNYIPGGGSSGGSPGGPIGGFSWQHYIPGGNSASPTSTAASTTAAPVVELAADVPALSSAPVPADLQYYIPGGAASGGGLSAGGSFSVSGSGCAGAMQQCGGDWYDGPSCCEAGYNCAKLGHYAGYKECMPIAGSSDGGGSSVDGGSSWGHYVPSGGGGGGGSHGSGVQLGGDWQYYVPAGTSTAASATAAPVVELAADTPTSATVGPPSASGAFAAACLLFAGVALASKFAARSYRLQIGEDSRTSQLLLTV